MAEPTTREEFKEYCLRACGKPVIKINVDDTQTEDRIDDAIAYYRDYHFDGTEDVVLKHVVTQTDINNEYITLAEKYIGVQTILDIGGSLNTANLFNAKYQFHLNDVFRRNFSSSLSTYVMAMRHIETLEEVLVGEKPIRYNRHTNQLHVDMDWSEDVTVGDYIIVRAYAWLDGDDYPNLWKDWWLRKYATQLIKKQWGENMKKFGGQQLPGGITLDGKGIYDEADAEVKALEEEMLNGFSLPAVDMTN
jgi:hypothetical protein